MVAFLHVPHGTNGGDGNESVAFVHGFFTCHTDLNENVPESVEMYGLKMGAVINVLS